MFLKFRFLAHRYSDSFFFFSSISYFGWILGVCIKLHLWNCLEIFRAKHHTAWPEPFFSRLTWIILIFILTYFLGIVSNRDHSDCEVWSNLVNKFLMFFSTDLWLHMKNTILGSALIGNVLAPVEPISALIGNTLWRRKQIITGV